MAIDEFNFTPFGDGHPRWFRGSAYPTDGTYIAGDIVFNTSPTGTGPAFWFCVTGNSTGGVWVSQTINTAAAASPSDASVTWAAGSVVFNSAPTAAGPVGWIAQNAGAGSAANFLAFGQVNPTLPLTTTATSGTLSSAYFMILLNPASTGTYSLPNVTAYPGGSALFIKNLASGSTTLTPLAANGYDVAAITLAQLASISLRSAGGTVWYRQQ